MLTEADLDDFREHPENWQDLNIRIGDVLPEDYVYYVPADSHDEAVIEVGIKSHKHVDAAMLRYGVRYYVRKPTHLIVASMTLADATAIISNAVYAATALLEQLEYAGKIRGNGHHARQKVASAAAAELVERWIDDRKTI